MALGWSWSYEIFQKEDAAIPEVIANTGYTSRIPGASKSADPVSMAWPLAISANSRNQAAAAEWVKWLTNPDLDLRAIVAKDDPTRATVVANRLSSLRSPEAAEANGSFSEIMADAYATASPMPVYIEFPEVSVILEAALTEIATGADVAETLNAAAVEIEDIMARSGRYE